MDAFDRAKELAKMARHSSDTGHYEMAQVKAQLAIAEALIDIADTLRVMNLEGLSVCNMTD